MNPHGTVQASSSPCSGQRAIDAHFRGRIAPQDERSMRVHLAGCAACREHYDRHLHLVAVDPDGGLPARERLARGLGLPRGSQPPRSGARGLRLLVPAAALGLCALVGLGLFRPHTVTPQARGSAAGPGAQLLVYEIAKQRPVRQVVSEIDEQSSLAFAYVNVARKRRLWIFAVDEERHVYWYQPAWIDGRENPIGIPIAADDAVHEIPQAIAHRFKGRRLQLFGVFGDQDLTVRDVEAAVARTSVDGWGRLRLTLPGAEITQLALALSGKP